MHYFGTVKLKYIKSKMHSNQFVNLFIVWLLVIKQTCAYCNSGQNTRENYIFRPQETKDIILFNKFNDVINSCRFGKRHSIFDRNSCFDHCTLRGKECKGVQTSEEGCKFCLSAEFDQSRKDNVDFSNIYINRTTLRGKKLFNLSY